MTKDFRTDVEFNNSLTASAGTTRLGTTNISGNITMLNTGTPALLWQTYTVASAVNTTFKYMEMLAKPIGTSNTDGLRFFINRDVGGADWQSESWNIQRYVDGTSMGYIQFGSDYPFEQNIKLGIGSTDYIYVTSTNTIISNNLTASVGTATFGVTSLSSASISGSAIATQNWVQSQGYSTAAGSVFQFTSSSATTTNTSTTAYVIPAGFASATMYAGNTYEFEINIFMQMSAAVAANHVFYAPANTAGGYFVMLGTNTTQVSLIGSNNTINTGSNAILNTTNMNTAAVEAPHVIKGWIKPSASGVFYYGGFKPAAAATASAFYNSWMKVTKVN